METQTSSKMWENISRIWHTSLSVSLLQSSINTVIPWHCFDVAFPFSLHLGCIPSQEKLGKKKKSCQLATLSLHLSSFYQLVQVIITLTAFSVFTLSPQPESFIQRRVLRQSTPQSPRHFNLLLPAPLHTGTDWCMQASCRSSSLCQDSYLSQSCQRCDWQPVRGSTHLLLPPPSLRLGLNLPRDSRRADMTSEPRCHAQGISAADDTVTSSTIGCM